MVVKKTPLPCQNQLFFHQAVFLVHVALNANELCWGVALSSVGWQAVLFTLAVKLAY